MRKCPKCGAKILDKDANACGNCGVWFEDVGCAVEVDGTSADDASSNVAGNGRPDANIQSDFGEDGKSIPYILDDIATDDIPDFQFDDDVHQAMHDDGLENDIWDIIQELQGPGDEVSSQNKDKGTGDCSRTGNVSGNDSGRDAFEVADVPDEGASDCRCLRLEYDWNTFSIENVQNYLSFRLTPLAVQEGSKEVFTLERVEFSYRFLETDKYTEASTHRGRIEKDRAFKIRIPVNKQAGIYYIDFKVKCLMNNGDIETYVFQQKHVVFAKQRDHNSPPVVFYKSNFDIKQAGRLIVDVDKIATSGKTFEEKIEELANLHSAYRVKALHALSGGMVGKQVGSILLRVGGYAVYVIGKTSVQMGRFRMWRRKDREGMILESAENDLVVRIPGIDSEQPPNRTVSSTHGILSILCGALTYQDTSSFGTRIDDGDWLIRNSCQLRGDRPSVLRFGNILMKLAPCVCGRREDDDLCENCVQMEGGICSVVLRRQDREQEIYLVVPACCDLGQELPELPWMKGWVLYSRKGAFGVRKPDGVSCPLDVGKCIAYGGVMMKVEEFRQMGARSVEFRPVDENKFEIRQLTVE